MARQDTSVGFQNFTVTPSQYTAGTEQALIAPTASGVYPGLPSPVFPLSTSTYPTVMYLSIPPDVTPGASWDGHEFQVKFAAKFTSTANFSLLVNLYQATNAVLAGGPSSSAYSVVTALTGTGVTKMITGTSTAANSTSGTVVLTANYIWDSTSKVLGIANAATTYQKGVSISTANTATTVTALGPTDLNFYPSLTFTTSLPSSFVVTEFSINRI